MRHSSFLPSLNALKTEPAERSTFVVAFPASLAASSNVDGAALSIFRINFIASCIRTARIVIAPPASAAAIKVFRYDDSMCFKCLDWLIRFGLCVFVS